MGAECERKPRLRCQINRVIEHHNAAMAQHAARCRKGFIIHRRIEQAFREIGAQRSANLYSTDRSARPRATAETFNQLP